MKRYSVEPKDQIFVKCYWFLSVTWIKRKNIGKTISSKCNQKPFDLAKRSATDAFKTTSKIAIQKTAEATGDLIGNKTANIIKKVSKTLENIGHDTEKYRKRNLYPEKRQRTINDLRLV